MSWANFITVFLQNIKADKYICKICAYCKFASLNIFKIIGKERTSVQSSKTSRDASPSGSTALPTSKVNFAFQALLTVASDCTLLDICMFCIAWKETLYAAVKGRVSYVALQPSRSWFSLTEQEGAVNVVYLMMIQIVLYSVVTVLFEIGHFAQTLNCYYLKSRVC